MDKKNPTFIGLLQLIGCLGIGGIGRLVTGDRKGVWQLVLSLVLIGQIWSIIDGILILLNDKINY